jgi:hypothetical protein
MYASPYAGESPGDARVALDLRRRRIRGIEHEQAAQPPTSAVPAAPSPGDSHLMADRNAQVVADMLGVSQPRTGVCHYCGLSLNRYGECEECR